MERKQLTIDLLIEITAVNNRVKNIVHRKAYFRWAPGKNAAREVSVVTLRCQRPSCGPVSAL